MQREGYAVVNTRSVATEAGLKPPLVHYHFDTTDNLLLESYRRSAARSEILLRTALQSDRPLKALWDHEADPVRTVLAAQFMALAQQRPSIREEMERNVEKFRHMEAEALRPMLQARQLESRGFSPSVVAMLIAALGRAFAMEGTIGVHAGHEGVRALVEKFIDMVEPTPTGG